MEKACVCPGVREDFEANFQNAQMESVKGFSDDTMYLNVLWRIRVILNFRIMADKYGNVVHLGERDCSIQRRHQKKVLEESPSIAISEELQKDGRDRCKRQRRPLAMKMQGTIEFLLDKK